MSIIRIMLLCLLGFGATAYAQDKPAPSTAPQVDPLQAEFEAAMREAQTKAVIGAADVPLIDQAVLKLPKGYIFFPGPQSGRLLRAMGNRVTQDPLGMVVAGEGKSGQWFVVLTWDAAGYVKDDDAKNWKADELLQSIRDGTEAANEERRAKKIPESQIIGWVEAPAYDAAQHRLVWSVASKIKGDPDNAERGVNYNTYALGRDGYVSMNLVTGANTVDSERVFAKELLAALDFNAGKKYEEFNSSTDKVAEYGLAALIGGVALKKLGLFAVIAAFALKFAKVIAVAVLAFGAGATRFFRWRKSSQAKAGGNGDSQG